MYSESNLLKVIFPKEAVQRRKRVIAQGPLKGPLGLSIWKMS